MAGSRFPGSRVIAFDRLPRDPSGAPVARLVVGYPLTVAGAAAELPAETDAPHSLEESLRTLPRGKLASARWVVNSRASYSGRLPFKSYQCVAVLLCSALWLGHHPGIEPSRKAVRPAHYFAPPLLYPPKSTPSTARLASELSVKIFSNDARRRLEGYPHSCIERARSCRAQRTRVGKLRATIGEIRQGFPVEEGA